MKKVTIIIILLVVFGLVNVYGGQSTVTIGAGLRNVTGVDDELGENLYEKVYGTNNLAYSLDLGYEVQPYLEIFLHTDYFSAKGELTLTKEQTTLTLIPLEMGLRFLVGKKMLRPYLGAGAGYYLYKEESVIGSVDDKKFGFFVEGGLKFFFVPTVFLDLKIKNVFLKVDGGDLGQVQLGGLAFMGGIGFVF